jgi:hypothetical protein
LTDRPQFRALVVVATRERTHGRAVLELAAPEAPDTRYTLWYGLPPPDVPLHPSLAPRILTGRLQGEAVWLEARPWGAPLNRLGPVLEPAQVALVLRDCCEGLQALHEVGRVHGDVKSKRVVVGLGGYATLVGVGQRSGHPEEDLAALIRLGRSLTRERGLLRLPEVAPRDPSVLAGLLDARLEGEDEGALRTSISAHSAREAALIPEEPTVVRIEVETEERQRGRMDELAVVLGPESERTGSQPSWSGPAEEVTREAPVEDTHELVGESTADDIEGTGALPAVGDPGALRVQVLARILAPLRHPARPTRFQPSEGRPCEAVRARLAAGPPDPLPLPGEAPEQIRVEGKPPALARDVSITRVFRDRGTEIRTAPGAAPPPPAASSPAPRAAPSHVRGIFLALAVLIAVFAFGMLFGSALLYFLGPPP